MAGQENKINTAGHTVSMHKQDRRRVLILHARIVSHMQIASVECLLGMPKFAYLAVRSERLWSRPSEHQRPSGYYLDRTWPSRHFVVSWSCFTTVSWPYPKSITTARNLCAVRRHRRADLIETQSSVWLLLIRRSETESYQYSTKPQDAMA